MGVAGAGKSTVASALAAELGRPFLEGDDFHPLANVDKMSKGIPLTDSDRDPWLDALGRELSILSRSGRPAVASCSALKRIYREHLEREAPPVRFVFLEADRETLERRLADRPGHFADARLLQSQLETLEPPSGPAAIRVDASRPVPAIVQEILSRLRPPEASREGATMNASPAISRSSYGSWKSELVTDRGANGFRRVRRPDSPYAQPDSTVSEGIAYGMILAVVHDDQDLFDDFWKYSQHWANEHGLMHWYIDAEGSKPLGEGGATDSDEDIAWALLHAAERWGGSGSIGEPYADAARRQIDAVWKHEIDHSREGLLMPGDKWTIPGLFNPSYFAPSQYRVFGNATGNQEGWNQVVETGYRILSRCQDARFGNASNGLVPAWCLDDGTPHVPFPYGPVHHQYDSARTPYRIAQDWIWHREPRALDYCRKAAGFFAAMPESEFVDGWDLDGTPRPDADSNRPTESAVFVGCAAVAASCDPDLAAFAARCSERLATGTLTTRSRYYNLSWTALALAMLSGGMTEVRGI